MIFISLPNGWPAKARTGQEAIWAKDQQHPLFSDFVLLFRVFSPPPLAPTRGRVNWGAVGRERWRKRWETRKTRRQRVASLAQKREKEGLLHSLLLHSLLSFKKNLRFFCRLPIWSFRFCKLKICAFNLQILPPLKSYWMTLSVPLQRNRDTKCHPFSRPCDCRFLLACPEF